MIQLSIIFRTFSSTSVLRLKNESLQRAKSINWEYLFWLNSEHISLVYFILFCLMHLFLFTKLFISFFSLCYWFLHPCCLFSWVVLSLSFILQDNLLLSSYLTLFFPDESFSILLSSLWPSFYSCFISLSWVLTFYFASGVSSLRSHDSVSSLHQLLVLLSAIFFPLQISHGMRESLFLLFLKFMWSI